MAALEIYIRTVYPMLFVVAGVTFTWRECRSIMWAIAAGGAVIMSAANMFQDTSGHSGDRLGIEFGTIGNPNDYALHLIFALPFVMWVGLTAKIKVIRAAAWFAVAFCLVLILRTASRGALISMGAGILFWLIRGTMRQRMVLLFGGPILALALVAFVPKSSLVRIVSFSSSDADASQEALDSSADRRYLLRMSIIYTLEHPAFGVGLGQFMTVEGESNQVIGSHGLWHETHNAYTEVSSECGLVAFGLYVAAIVSTFLMVNRIYLKAKKAGCEHIRIATFCIMLCMVMFCTGITFLNFAYFFYLPLLTSLVTAISWSAEEEFAARPAAVAQPAFAPSPWAARRLAPGSGGGGRVAPARNV